MAGQIPSTRDAIAAYLEELKTLPGLHVAEQQAIADVLSSLRVLEPRHVRRFRIFEFEKRN
jgi:hypothetical protein